MRTKLRIKCDDCGTETHRTERIKSKFVCWKCVKKYRKIIYLGGSYPKYFKEPLKYTIPLNHISLTASQHKLLKERLNFLFPTYKKKPVSFYVRELILNDLDYRAKELKEEEKNEKQKNSNLSG